MYWMAGAPGEIQTAAAPVTAHLSLLPALVPQEAWLLGGDLLPAPHQRPGKDEGDLAVHVGVPVEQEEATSGEGREFLDNRIINMPQVGISLVPSP